jgi:hypothetical protein
VLVLSIPISAVPITANNAGALPGTAQDLTGVFPTDIFGTIPVTTDALLGVDMFKFNVQNATAFSAMVVPSIFGIPDTELFLFDSTGRGVLGNDDLSGANTLSCLPSVTSNPCVSSRPVGLGPLTKGVYYLAITRSANLPLSSLGSIFSILNFTDVVGPDLTQGGANPIMGWDGGAFTTPDTDLTQYHIVLTGTVPEPASWLLTGLGCLVLVFLRFRLSPHK